MIFTTYLPYPLQSLDQYNLQNHVKKPKILIVCSKNHSAIILHQQPALITYGIKSMIIS
jgi:hypothetical protein